MSGSFLRALEQLTEFIANHAAIEIGESVTSIPENVRSDFYSRFNSARYAFIQEKFPDYVSRARKLQLEYARVAEEISATLVLEDPPAVNGFRRFLTDPEECLARELFDPLFDLLKNRETPDSFEKKVTAVIDELFPLLYRGSYEKWVILSLASLLEMKRALRVPVRELQPADRGKSLVSAPMEPVPVPIESTHFYFSQSLKKIFAVPDFIVDSGRLNRFVGVRSEFREALCHALNASPDRNWGPVDVDLLRLLANGLTLLYTADKPEQVSLIADAVKFCRPDLVMWCVPANSVGHAEALAVAQQANDRLHPIKGVFIITDDGWQNTGNAEAPVAAAAASKVRILTVGFDRAKLIPVIESLSDEQMPATAT
jgi:hypothetical protein